MGYYADSALQRLRQDSVTSSHSYSAAVFFYCTLCKRDITSSVMWLVHVVFPPLSTLLVGVAFVGNKFSKSLSHASLCSSTKLKILVIE